MFSSHGMAASSWTLSGPSNRLEGPKTEFVQSIKRDERLPKSQNFKLMTYAVTVWTFHTVFFRIKRLSYQSPRQFVVHT